MKGSHYTHIPSNEHELSAGSILIPTEKSLNIFGYTTLDWILDQGGHKDTVIFVFGVNNQGPHTYIEAVFLNPDEPGFHPTWGVQQLMAEIERGSWTVIPTETVLESWATKVETLMNRR
jgi:hypothetical protein